MSLKISNEYIENGNVVTEYTKDGVNTSHITRISLDSITDNSKHKELTKLEQILFETQYQTMLLEMGGM